MTDPRPEPKYGQYGPLSGTEPVVPPSPQPTGPAQFVGSQFVEPQRARRTWDVLLTSMLLLVGVFDVVSGFPRFANLASALETVFAQQGLGEFTAVDAATTAGLIINVARVSLLTVAIVWSLKRLADRKLTFWVPLSAGLLAGLTAVVALAIVIMSDPAFAGYVASQQP